MTILLSPPAQSITTLADLLQKLGGIDPARVRYQPSPGTATEADVAAIQAREGRLYELVDGTLVEKTMGFRESLVAATILTLLNTFVMSRKLGVVSGADGALRLFPGLVRIPDVAYVSAQRLPGGRVPENPIPDLVPDLAVEVLSKSNTKSEMDRKRAEYFRAGVRLVWLIDPETRSAEVFDSPDASITIAADQTLTGGEVLPGFSVVLRDVFAALEV